MRKSLARDVVAFSLAVHLDLAWARRGEQFLYMLRRVACTDYSVCLAPAVSLPSLAG